MGTRATYQIDYTTFYIPDDGYPEGAADYFRNALDLPDVMKDRVPNASFADDFIRANSRARITPGHNYHYDTAYEYTVTTDCDSRFGPATLFITAQTTGLNGVGPGIFFNGTLDEFVSRYLRQEGYQPTTNEGNT